KSVNLSKQSHILAANIDEALLVVSLYQPRTPQGFMDRFILTAEAYHVPVSLIFNKVDLYDADTLALLNVYIQMYQAIGYRCYVCSATEKQGLTSIQTAMQNKVNLFSGNSGVGKSALINALDPSLHIKTGNISTYHNKGKHTTTFAEMHPLSFGGYIMDTPGIREFGMVAFTTEEVSLYFPEMRHLKAHCQFNNCTHVHEPRCAIKQAVEENKIHPWRYKSYLAILKGEEVETPGLIENKQDAKK
ncbi:MAG: ribosome small subunit-dependent GTPase A, partial [Bacteroidales bacterium]